MNKIRFLLLALVSSIAAFGCASGPELEKFNRRELDRPYTLPKGVADWQIPVAGGVFTTAGTTLVIPPIPVPLYWEMSLSDDWELDFSPLPLSVKHQFFNTDGARMGIKFGLGLGYSSVGGLLVSPSVALPVRFKASKNFGVDVTPTGAATIYSGVTFAGGMNVEPIFQVSDRVHLRVNGGASFASSLVVPSFGAGLGWVAGRQWDLDFSYQYLAMSLGSAGSAQGHLFGVLFKHYW